jgi:hypothetical protein
MPAQLIPTLTSDRRLSGSTMAIQLGVALVLCAPALLHLGVALPGAPGMSDLPGTVNYHWLVSEVGPAGLIESQQLMYPAVVDRLVLDGFPLDALASMPFTALFGWPAGFTVFCFACFLALGLAHALLARAWWGSPAAAAVAGVVAQCSPFLIQELTGGRLTQIFGAIFLPLILYFLLSSVARNCAKTGLLAGICMGLGTLAYWYYGVFFGLVALTVMGAAWRSGGALRSVLLAFGFGLVLVVAGPIAHTFSSINDVPGIGTAWADGVAHGGNLLSLTEILEHRDLGARVLSDAVLAPQLVVALLMVLTLRHQQRVRWLLPGVWLVMALLFAAGPTISILGLLDVPGPFRLFQAAPFLRRLWWPDRALVMMVPAMALLASGGVAVVLDRWQSASARPGLTALLISGLVLCEAFWVIPGLPMVTTWGAETEASTVLAAGTGPVLILPMGSGEREPDARMLIDQIHHGRPLVNGPMTPGVSAAPAAFSRFGETPGMAALIACERGRPSIQGAPGFADMRAVGIDVVYLDSGRGRALAGGRDSFERCIRRFLGPPLSEEGPYQIYAVP